MELWNTGSAGDQNLGDQRTEPRPASPCGLCRAKEARKGKVLEGPAARVSSRPLRDFYRNRDGTSRPMGVKTIMRPLMFFVHSIFQAFVIAI